MFRIFSTEQALTDICIGTKYPNWAAIAKKQSVIEIDCDSNSSVFYDEDNLLYQFGKMYDVEFKDNANYISGVATQPQTVLDNPCGAFIVDVDPSKANDISASLGVICQSAYNIDDAEIYNLLFYTKEITSIQTKNNHSWKTILHQLQNIPSNLLVVNDRNLFVNDDSIKKDGVENIVELADSILPNRIDCEYQILILTSELKTGVTLSQISSWINKKIRNIRPYPIVVEIVHIIKGCNCPTYDKTHNRRLITNYSTLIAEHKYQAFSGTVSLCDQTLVLDTLYSKGITNDSDCPEIKHRKTVEDINSVISHAKSHPNNGYYAYAINGNANNISTANIKNRLFK